MLAPFSRLTLGVIAALLISVVDGTFEADESAARAADSGALILALDEFAEYADDSRPLFDSIGRERSGTDVVRLKAKVDAPSMSCKLTIVYGSGETKVLDDVVSDADGVCATAFVVSDEASAVGTAQVRLEVVDDQGRTEGEVIRAFTVR